MIKKLSIHVDLEADDALRQSFDISCQPNCKLSEVPAVLAKTVGGVLSKLSAEAADEHVAELKRVKAEHAEIAKAREQERLDLTMRLEATAKEGALLLSRHALLGDKHAAEARRAAGFEQRTKQLAAIIARHPQAKIELTAMDASSVQPPPPTPAPQPAPEDMPMQVKPGTPADTAPKQDQKKAKGNR